MNGVLGECCMKMTFHDLMSCCHDVLIRDEPSMARCTDIPIADMDSLHNARAECLRLAPRSPALHESTQRQHGVFYG